MNRTRTVGLLAALFVSSVGAGVALSWDDRPVRQVATVARVSATTTTLVARTTTTRVTATTTPSTTTTSPRPTTTRVRLSPTVTGMTLPPPPPPTPSTDPPTTPAPTTTPTTAALGYDPLQCADINRQYDVAGIYDAPERIALLQQVNCPPFYWD